MRVPRHEAAPDVDPAARAEGEGHVGGERAEELRREVEHLAAPRRALADPLGHDVLRGRTRAEGLLAVEAAKGVVQTDEPRSGQHPFGRDVAELAGDLREDPRLAPAGRRHRGVPALSLDHRPAAAGGNQAGHPEAGAGPEHRDGRPRGRPAAADLQAVRLPEMRHPARDGAEVVDHRQGLEAEAPAEGLHRERPRVVGEAHPVPGDRTGDRDGRPPRANAARGAVEIGIQGLGEPRVVGARANRGAMDRAVRPDEAEPRPGTADVPDQPRHARQCKRTRRSAGRFPAVRLSGRRRVRGGSPGP